MRSHDTQKYEFRQVIDPLSVTINPYVCWRVRASDLRFQVPMDVKGVPKPVNSQGGNHDGKSGSNPDPPDGNRDTAHRVTPAMRRALPARTRTLENKVSYPRQPSLACVPDRLLETQIRSRRSIGP